MSIFNLTNTIISGSSDISCVAYNDIIKSRTNAIINNISAGKIGPIRGQPRRALPFVNNNIGTGTIDIAGATFNLNFPSECQFCSTLNQNDNCDFCRTPDKSNCFTCKLYQTLLKKKGYIFTNSNNKNVVSGPIQWRTKNGVITILQFGGTSGAGLTKKQQLSNVGKGLTPDGKPSKKFGVQSYDGIRLYSNSNIYSDTIPTNNGVISICKNNISIYPSLGKYFTKNSNIINSSSFIYNARFTIVNNIIYVLIFNQSTSNYEIRSNNVPIITSKIDCWKLEYYTEEPLQAIAVDKNNAIYFSIATNKWCGDVYERTTVNTRNHIGHSCRLTLLKMPIRRPDIPLTRVGGQFITMTSPIITLTEVDMTNFANNNKYFFTTDRQQYNIHYYKHSGNYTSNLSTHPPVYKTIANPKINNIIINIVQVECSDRYLYALSYILSGTIFRWDLDKYPLDNNFNNSNNWDLIACKVNLNEYGQNIDLGSWSYRPLMVLSIDNDRNEHIFVENNNKIIRVSDTPICKLILDYNINITTDLEEYYNETSHIITSVNIITGVNNYSHFDLIYNARFTIVNNVIYVLWFNSSNHKYEIRSCFLGDEIMVKSKINGWRLEYYTEEPLQAIAVDKHNTIYFSIATNKWCGDVYERTTVNTRNHIGHSCRLTLLKMPPGRADIPLSRDFGQFKTMTDPIITLTEGDMTNFANNNKYFFTTHREQYNIRYYKHNGNYINNLSTQPPVYKTIANPKINDIKIHIVQVECSDRYLYALCHILSGTIFRWDLDKYPLDNNFNNYHNWDLIACKVNLNEYGQNIDRGSLSYRPLMVLSIDNDRNEHIFVENNNKIIRVSDTPICKLILDYNINITTDLEEYYNETSHIITSLNIITGVNNYSDFDLIYNARFTIVNNVIYVLIFNQSNHNYEIRSCFLGDEIMVKSKINGWRLEYSTTDKLNAIVVDKHNTIYFNKASGWCGDVYELNVNSNTFATCRLTLLKMPIGQNDIPLVRGAGIFTTMTDPIITLTEGDMTNFANNNKYFFTTYRQDQYNIRYYKHNGDYITGLSTQPPVYKTIANPKINGIDTKIVQVECSDKYLYALCYDIFGTIFRWDLDTYPLDNNNNNNNNHGNWVLIQYSVNLGEFGQDIITQLTWSYRPLMVLFTDEYKKDNIYVEHRNTIYNINQLSNPRFLSKSLNTYYNETSHIITSPNNYSNSHLIYNARFSVVNNIIYVLIFNQSNSNYEIRSCDLNELNNINIDQWKLEHSTSDTLNAIVVDKYNTIYFSKATTWCGNVYKLNVNSNTFVAGTCRLTLLKMPIGQNDIPLVRGAGVFHNIDQTITLTEGGMTNFANNNTYFFTTHRQQYNIRYYKHNGDYITGLSTQAPNYTIIAKPKINGIDAKIVQVECSDRYLYALCYDISGTIFRWDLDTYPLDNNYNNSNNWEQRLYNINIGEFGQDIDSIIGSWTYRPLMVLFTDSDENDQIFIEHQNMIIQIL